MTRQSYIWCPVAGALVPKGTDAASQEHHHYVRGDVADFVSPIDGAVIHGRAGLRRHMQKHGVVPQAEVCPKEMAQKAAERRQMAAFTHPSQKAERLEVLRGAFESVRNAQRARRRYG